MHIPPITIYDRPLLHKRSQYTPDKIPSAISISSENYVSTLTTSSDSPYLLPCDDPNNLHIMKNICLYKVVFTEDTYVGNTVKKDSTKRRSSIAPHALIIIINVIIVMVFPGLFHRKGLDSWNINIVCHNVSVDCFDFIPSILYFECWNCFVLVLFLFHWSLPVIYHISYLIDYLVFYFFNCLNVCDESLVIQIICTGHLYA